MSHRIKYMPRAKADLTRIGVYLSQYYRSTAKKFFTLLTEKIKRLKEFPYSCPIYEDAPNFRKLVVSDYIVLYKVIEDTKTVEVHRIFHGSQDISRHLANERINIPQ